MKTLYFLMILIGATICLSAQSPAYEGGKEPRAYEPPKLVYDKFRAEYPTITPTWHVDQNYYVADFADTNSLKAISIVYDRNAKIVRREAELQNSQYPSSINSYFVKNYPGEKFKTWKSTDDKGVQSYCIKRPDGSLWFDTQGNYLDPQKKSEQITAAN